MRLYPVLLVFSSSVLAQVRWFVTRERNDIHHLTFATPIHPLQLSNQPFLICYNRGPSGPYYSNPCDVIPKHCFLLSEKRTILYLTTDGRISSLFHLHFLLLSVRSALRQRLMDHFINNKPAANHQHKQCIECLLSCEKKCVCMYNFFLFAKQSQEVCGALPAHTHRGDVSCLCVWVAPNGVSCLTTRLRVFSSFFFLSVQSCMLGFVCVAAGICS